MIKKGRNTKDKTQLRQKLKGSTAALLRLNRIWKFSKKPFASFTQSLYFESASFFNRRVVIFQRVQFFPQGFFSVYVVQRTKGGCFLANARNCPAKVVCRTNFNTLPSAWSKGGLVKTNFSKRGSRDSWFGSYVEIVRRLRPGHGSNKDVFILCLLFDECLIYLKYWKYIIFKWNTGHF